MAQPLQELKGLTARVRELGPRGVLAVAREQPRYWWRMLRHAYRLFVENRGPYQANALAYRSMLSMVPMLVFVISLSAWIFGEKVDVYTNRLKTILKEYVMPRSMDHFPGMMAPGANPLDNPDSPDDATADDDAAIKKTDIVDDIWVYVERFKKEAGSGTRGGFLILMITSVFLINGLEMIFNNVWHIRRNRPAAWRILSYTAMTVLIPLLFGLSIYMTAQVQVASVERALSDSLVFKHIPLFRPTWGLIKDLGIPIATVWVLFLAMYKFLPNTKVETSSALVGSLAAAVLFESAKWGFSFFTARMVESRQIYWGPIGIFIVFLVWVYLIWYIVLFCAQLTYVIQNYRYVLRTTSDLKGRFGNAYLACRLMLEIGKRHYAGEQVPTVRELAAQLRIEVPRIQGILASLTDANLVILGATNTRNSDYEEIYVPGRDLGAITVSEVVRTVSDTWRLPPATMIIADQRDLAGNHEAGANSDSGEKPLDPELELNRLLLGSQEAMEAGLTASFRDLLQRSAPASSP
jgi:YihY family inner membrane protein